MYFQAILLYLEKMVEKPNFRLPEYVDPRGLRDEFLRQTNFSSKKTFIDRNIFMRIK
jgi:hypothetical protein